MSALPDPLTIEALVDLLDDPTWRDSQGRNLIQAVTAAHPDDGARMWREAEQVFLTRAATTPRQRSDQWLQIVVSSYVDRGAK